MVSDDSDEISTLFFLRIKKDIDIKKQNMSSAAVVRDASK